MNDRQLAFPLGPEALARAQQMLPGLLAAVRRRRRRRRVVRAAAACGALVAALVWWWPAGAARQGLAPPGPEQVAAWTTVRDDPTAVARYRVATVSRPEWFVDDAGLQALLQDAGRPAGIVRAGGAVRISSAAVDAWPESLPLEE